MYEENFPVRLAELRTQKGVSAREMSLSLGQSENYINMIENRKTFPSMVVFFYICEYLKITPMEFFDTDNPFPERLTKLIAQLKSLDDKTLSHIEGIVEGLLDRK